jgi:glyoxylase-like metal-dependent hydrolase (beta-lactamase superfamily II)
MAGNRREFLRMTLAGVAAAAAAPRTALARQRPAGIVATKLADRYFLLTGAGSNVLAVTGSDGVLMIDSGAADHSAGLLDAVARVSNGARIRTVFNTHWHLDHTGGNDVLGRSGATIVAHENTKLWMGAEILCKWQNRTYPPRAKEARPTRSFYAKEAMTFGTERIEYGHLGQAHTDGDIYAFFPGPNILMTGDVFSAGSYPVLDYTTGGWIGGLSEASRTLLDLTDAQTRVVPGAGPVQARADLQAQADMLATMRTRFVEMMRKGMGVKEMLAAAPTKEFDARWGDPQLFIANAYPGLWGHVRELGAIV